MTAHKVGDVVAWADVPNGALVRSYCDKSRFEWWYLRRGDKGSTAGIRSERDRLEGRSGGWWEWSSQHLPPTWTLWTHPEHVTIVALNLTGQETAEDLRRLAEVFDVREALRAQQNSEAWGVFWGPYVDRLPDVDVGTWRYDDMLTEAAERLHAAGWRPGMTAEDAARLLAEKDKA